MIPFLAPCTHGEVELFGSPVARAGSVRVCINGTWGKVCNGERDNYFASIVCSQLGFSPYGIETINLVLVTSLSLYLQVLMQLKEYGLTAHLSTKCINQYAQEMPPVS